MTAGDADLVWTTLERLRAGEPLRIVLGEKLYASSEIVVSDRFATRLRRMLVDELTEALTLPEPPAPAAPVQAQPLGQAS